MNNTIKDILFKSIALFLLSAIVILTWLPARAALLSVLDQVIVECFVLTGNTVFSAEELATVTVPYNNRSITAEELQEVRRRLILYYAERGYLNSDVIIPDQQVEQGVVQIQLIKSRLIHIEVTGNQHLRAAYLQDRLRSNSALNVQTLQDRLQHLQQQNPLIEQIHAA